MGRLLVAAYFCLRPLTSEIYTGQWPETEIGSNQEPARLALPVLNCAGDRPADFPPLCFTPSLANNITRDRSLIRGRGGGVLQKGFTATINRCHEVSHLAMILLI